MEQLNAVLGSEDNLPSCVLLVNTSEGQGQKLSKLLSTNAAFKLICTHCQAEVKATLASIVNRIQKFCNTNSRAPNQIRIVVAGTDAYMNVVLRPYVEQFSAKPPDWQAYVKFIYIPLSCTSTLAKYLSTIDSLYASFCEGLWKEFFDTKGDSPDSNEIVNKLQRYLEKCHHTVQMPIAEALIVRKDKCHLAFNSEDDSNRISVPFIMDVRVGPIELPNVNLCSVDYDESSSSVVMGPNSPPSSTSGSTDRRQEHSPPGSPNFSANTTTSNLMSPSDNRIELIDLQLDYWHPASLETCKEREKEKEKSFKKEIKCSLKTQFKSVLIYRLILPNKINDPHLISLTIATKEKSKKLMRIGKKNKEESKTQLMINRLVCTTKSQSQALSTHIDGHEWQAVKFFQINPLWPTHVKYLPFLIAVDEFSYSLPINIS
ncbi:DgyrCDS9185 [Dimorphilus gyrociliatus]|uniref:DgyrCDS9185 n=1 Tax=Dimorphilus gyrociliatus TaxID=2664684 RepID=A0A7I8W1I5_9ANNE|nr:DgyrCDS9185 [Dimorphilus gyrociliatus]